MQHEEIVLGRNRKGNGFRNPLLRPCIGGAHRLEFPYQPVGVPQEIQSLYGKRNAAVTTVQNGETQLFFQKADGFTDAGLRDKHGFCCLRDGAELRGTNEILQLLHGHQSLLLCFPNESDEKIGHGSDPI